MGSPKVLVTGVTGLVGGSVLSQLLHSSFPEIRELSISGLVRKQEQADLLSGQNVTSILFRDLDDSDLLRQVAREHDIVIHCANGQHTGSAVALIEGLAERKKSTRREVHFIQTSGTGNLAELTITKTLGTPRKWSDKDLVYEHEEALETLETFPQRTSDLAVVMTAENAGVRAYIMMPPTIYGRGTGFFNQRSMQIPILISSAIRDGFAAYIGEGSATVGHVHVSDLARFYELVLSKIIQGQTIPHNRRGIYFSNTGDISWRDIAEGVGRAGADLGVLESAAPRSVSLEYAAENWMGGNLYFAELAFASRCSTTPTMAYELGWQPLKTEDDWRRSFHEAFQMVLYEQAGGV